MLQYVVRMRPRHRHTTGAAGGKRVGVRHQKVALGEVLDEFCRFRAEFKVGFGGLSNQSGTIDRDIGLDPGYVGGFRLGFGLSGGLTGILRYEASFRLFPFFLGVYEIGVSPVEGAFGGGLVADEEAKLLGDAEFVAGERQAEENLALEVESAEGQPLCRVPDYAACSRVRRIFIGFNLGSARHSFDAFAGTLEA
jgi:hypothetical protein